MLIVFFIKIFDIETGKNYYYNSFLWSLKNHEVQVSSNSSFKQENWGNGSSYKKIWRKISTPKCEKGLWFWSYDNEKKLSERIFWIPFRKAKWWKYSFILTIRSWKRDKHVRKEDLLFLKLDLSAIHLKWITGVEIEKYNVSSRSFKTFW